jgi:hypothetical protein
MLPTIFFMFGFKSKSPIPLLYKDVGLFDLDEKK